MSIIRQDHCAYSRIRLNSKAISSELLTFWFARVCAVVPRGVELSLCCAGRAEILKLLRSAQQAIFSA